MTAFTIRATGLVGGNIRASVSRPDDDYVWDETSTDWIDANGLGFIHDNSSVQMDGVPGRRGAYKCTFPFTTTYSGELVVRVHDSNQTNEVMDEKIFYSRAGNIVGSVMIGQDFTNQEIAEALTFTLSRRTDGTIGPNRDMTIGIRDVGLPFAFDTRLLFKHGISVLTVAVSSVTSPLEVEAHGPQGQLAILELVGAQVVGQSYALECSITMSNAAQITAPLLITCN